MLWPYKTHVEASKRVSVYPYLVVFFYASIIYLVFTFLILPGFQEKPVQTAKALSESEARAMVAASVRATFAAPTPTLAFFPSPTLQPTSTPYPVSTSEPGPRKLDYALLSVKRLSFYDPDIGKAYPEIAEVNCVSWNYQTQNCDSTLSDGSDWRLQYETVAACDLADYERRAVYRILSPEWLRERVPVFLCADTGAAVQGNIIDLLLHWDDLPGGYTLATFPWLTEIIVEEVPQ